MKRFSYSVCAAFMAAALLLSCNKKIDSPSVTAIKGLTITALHDASSRTTFDGEKSKWSDGDKMNVLISASDDSSIGPNEFEITDAENAKFSNSDVVTNAGETYKFYAVYPVCDISADKCASIKVGAAEQEQVGTSANHIAALDPLYGYNESTPEAVSIPMKHTAVVMKLDIKNLTGNANLVVKKVKVKAPTGIAIAGSCNLNIESGAISPSSEGSNVIELDVKDASEIAENGIFTAWVAAAPFTIARGGSLLFTVVDGDDNVYDVIKSFPDGRNFESGKILSATLEIKEKVSLGALKEVTLDFTKSENLQPLSDSKNPKESLTYQSGPYLSYIYATAKCYYNSKLVLSAMETNDYATISLPQLSGYKISEITFINGKDEDSTISAKIELYTHDGVLCKIKTNEDSSRQYYHNIAKKEVTISNIIGIENDSQYYLKLTSSASHAIDSWIIRYAKI
ncbi:MAG: fimbrillin family protein [Alistipes sp.]|nr:fimbrillin family protein [Alistipes sp.]